MLYMNSPLVPESLSSAFTTVTTLPSVASSRIVASYSDSSNLGTLSFSSVKVTVTRHVVERRRLGSAGRSLTTTANVNVPSASVSKSRPGSPNTTPCGKEEEGARVNQLHIYVIISH